MTIRQIAELAGVSRGTVDRALNNRGGVSPEKEAKIKAIAKKYDYHPNAFAKALANSKKSIIIGEIINGDGNIFFDDVFFGMESYQKNIDCVKIQVKKIVLSGYDVQEQLNALNEMSKNNISGLIITPIIDPIISQRLNSLIKSGVHVVMVNADLEDVTTKLAYVGCDYFTSGQTAACLLSQITNRVANVAIITGTKNALWHSKRIDGFQNVVEVYNNMNICGIYEGKDNNNITYQVTKKALEENDVTAIYFACAGIDGGIKAICEKKLENKIKIISVDNTVNIKKYISKGIINMTICQ
ncbi:MAG: LacI family DNA-binding transcriptional regulator, partial [Oscillospiraceae bacterium]